MICLKVNYSGGGVQLLQNLKQLLLMENTMVR